VRVLFEKETPPAPLVVLFEINPPGPPLTRGENIVSPPLTMGVEFKVPLVKGGFRGFS